MPPVTSDASRVAPLASVVDLTIRSARWLAFWVAILLPWLYLPLLAFGRTDAGLAGVGLHALAVLLGQGHGRRQ